VKEVHENAHVHVHDCGRRASANVPEMKVRRFQRVGYGITYMMMVPPHSEHTEQVHTQTEGADEQQLTGIHFRRIEAGSHCQYHREIDSKGGSYAHSLDRLKYDKYRNQDEENPVCEPRQCFDPPVSIGKPFISGPSCHHRCYQSNRDGHTIERHVYR